MGEIGISAARYRMLQSNIQTDVVMAKCPFYNRRKEKQSRMGYMSSLFSQDANHQCTLVCGKRLRCGIHNCMQQCHRGHCEQCWEYSESHDSHMTHLQSCESHHDPPSIMCTLLMQPASAEKTMFGQPFPAVVLRKGFGASK